MKRRHNGKGLNRREFMTLLGMGAGGIMEAAVQEAMDSDTLPVALSWGFYVGLLMVLAGIALTVLYFREVGYELVIDSFAFWKGTDEPEGRPPGNDQGRPGPFNREEHCARFGFG